MSSDTHLDTEVLPFGALPLGSQLIKSVQIINDGEVGTNFNWEFPSKYSKEFLIKPTSGFVAAK